MMSLRLRFLLIVVVASVIPLGLVGLWLTASARRSGETMLEDRLSLALTQSVELVTSQWIRQRSALLNVAEDPGVQALLGSGSGEAPGPGAAASIPTRPPALDPAILRIEVEDAEGRTAGIVDGGEVGGESPGWVQDGQSLLLRLPVFDRLSGAQLGTLRVVAEPELLLPPERLPASTAGMVLTLLDDSGRPLTPVPLQLPGGGQDRFLWAGEEWMLMRRDLDEPAVSLVAAATLGPALAPFERTARQGTLLLGAVMLLALASTAWLTTRMTRSLGQLSEAADAVAAGDLARRIPEKGNDEVSRVARAFNQMTERLKRTMDRMAGTESLAAVGEFAAGLAHEVRNPLTSVQIDLQLVESELPPGSDLLEAQQKALSEIRRLDSTVRDALRVARSGTIQPRAMDIRGPLEAAALAARPVFEARGAELILELPSHDLMMDGDPGALEQLFLNLMQNAGQALGRGGRAEVSVRKSEPDIVVLMKDDGPGMPESVRERVFEPLFSTRREGTGLGLPIAQRIALAHGGTIRIRSAPGEGTEVEVRLPASPIPDPELAGGPVTSGM
jgi:signal transduction histidine kinase